MRSVKDISLLIQVTSYDTHTFNYINDRLINTRENDTGRKTEENYQVCTCESTLQGRLRPSHVWREEIPRDPLSWTEALVTIVGTFLSWKRTRRNLEATRRYSDTRIDSRELASLELFFSLYICIYISSNFPWPLPARFPPGGRGLKQGSKVYNNKN